MGREGNALLRGADPAQVADELDRLFCYHMLASNWALGVRNRLEGQPLYLLNDELEQVHERNLTSALALAYRVAELGGAVTVDPAAMLRQASLETVELPDCADLGSILGMALARTRTAIRTYGQVLDRTAGDELSRVLLLELLRHEVARESDLEAAGAR
ncbi:ferritin-like domain-containing protein [Nonomuraea sp. NPDC050556]|uniref:ferritin-like domain-containing protein n=1 Tax=Nonomuraea sp. NPDC050556 TaxID=3364369 RepID=UPI0037966AC4